MASRTSTEISFASPEDRRWCLIAILDRRQFVRRRQCEDRSGVGACEPRLRFRLNPTRAFARTRFAHGKRHLPSLILPRPALATVYSSHAECRDRTQVPY